MSFVPCVSAMTLIQASLAPSVGHLVCQPGNLALGKRLNTDSFFNLGIFLPKAFIFSMKMPFQDVFRDL